MSTAWERSHLRGQALFTVGSPNSTAPWRIVPRLSTVASSRTPAPAPRPPGSSMCPLPDPGPAQRARRTLRSADGRPPRAGRVRRAARRPPTAPRSCPDQEAGSAPMTTPVRTHGPDRTAPAAAGAPPSEATVESAPAGATPAAQRPAGRRSPQRRRRARRDALLFLALIAPNFLAIIVFSYYPALYNIGLSFFEWDFVEPVPEWVGAANYADLFTSASFGQVLMNTLIFTGVSVIGSLVLGLLLGSLLATKVPFTGFAQTMAFAPHMLPGAAVGILWLFMFDPNYGLSRWAFSLFGADSPAWTTTSDWSLWSITIAYTWQRLGFVTVICYTAILDLPKDLYEAAALDGAHGWKLFRHLTLPLLSPITFFLSITGIISAAQAFDIISIMTG